MTKKKGLLHHHYLSTGLLVGLIVLLITAGYFIYQTQTLKDSLTTLSSEKESVIGEKQTVEEQLTEAKNTILALQETLDLTQEDLDDLEDDYRKEKNKNDHFEDQLDDLSSTLGVLDKLSKTDEELLQKYSKVSFLNEHYVPESTKEIDDDWKYSEDKPNALHSKVMPFFEEMLEDAKDDGIDLWVASAYRSFDTQAQLKGAYTITYGSGANAFSADQGFSEHQLGTTIDFTTSGLSGGLTGFENTEAYEWMLDNAHKYGFTLSYAEDNQYYVFEPWHWRFVGTDLAKDLERKGDTFYDWEQREIDSYLIKIFD